MALASYFTGQDIAEERLPIRMAAVSRCFRAETSNIPQEKGIYRYWTNLYIFSLLFSSFYCCFIHVVRGVYSKLILFIAAAPGVRRVSSKFHDPFKWWIMRSISLRCSSSFPFPAGFSSSSPTLPATCMRACLRASTDVKCDQYPTREQRRRKEGSFVCVCVCVCIHSRVFHKRTRAAPDAPAATTNSSCKWFSVLCLKRHLFSFPSGRLCTNILFPYFIFHFSPFTYLQGASIH